VTTDPSASVRLAAVLDRSAGQQNNGLFIFVALVHPIRSVGKLLHSPEMERQLLE